MKHNPDKNGYPLYVDVKEEDFWNMSPTEMENVIDIHIQGLTTDFYGQPPIHGPSWSDILLLALSSLYTREHYKVMRLTVHEYVNGEFNKWKGLLYNREDRLDDVCIHCGIMKKDHSIFGESSA